MLKSLIRDYVKYNKTLNALYTHLGSIVLRMAAARNPIEPKKAFFISFGGRRYDDSPKCIYECMLTMDYFADWDFVWAFVDPDNTELAGDARIVKMDTLEYYQQLLSSRVWITNASIERGLSFKRDLNLSVNTWHGVPIKRIGKESLTYSGIEIPRSEECFDIMCTESLFDKEIFSRVFNVADNSILTCGLPRNDSLLSYSREDIEGIKKQLKIPPGKKVLLYTPTFREFRLDKTNTPRLSIPINFEKWESILGAEYVLLLRAHYLVTKSLNLKSSDFIRDVSQYDTLNDLYAISDAMISDYSSTIIDYSILGRPIFCFAYDWEEYAAKRGFYSEVLNDLPCSIDVTEDELLYHIRASNYEEMAEKTRHFAKKYAPHNVNASTVLCETIIQYLSTTEFYGTALNLPQSS